MANQCRPSASIHMSMVSFMEVTKLSLDRTFAQSEQPSLYVSKKGFHGELIIHRSVINIEYAHHLFCFSSYSLLLLN